MKQLFLLSLVSLWIVGCRKDVQPGTSDYLATARRALQDSLGTTDFGALDFARAARLKVDSLGFYALRVPFKGKVPNEDFVFVRTNAEGRVEKGKIVHLQGSVTNEGNSSNKRKRWDGHLRLTSLDRKIVFESAIVDGVITAFHQQNRLRTELQEPQRDFMSEVIITYVRSSGGGFTWSSWFSLQSFFGSSDGGWGGYYSSFSSGGGGSESWSGGGGDAGGGGGSSGDDDSGSDTVILIDKEYQDSNPAIDIQQYIKCFNNIPDAGSACSIEIYADIPVDNNPNAFFDISTMSPGHTFISISKSNGTQRVVQNIGFYPKSGYKSMTYAPTAGKLVDNARHEFNASLFMNMTPAQLTTVLLRMQQLSNLNYDVDQYNCSDWALDIFNSIRADKLEIPLYGIPGSPMTQGTRTPQGLFQKLQEMVNSNDPEKGNITIGIIKGYAGGSIGPCN